MDCELYGVSKDWNGSTIIYWRCTRVKDVENDCELKKSDDAFMC